MNYDNEDPNNKPIESRGIRCDHPSAEECKSINSKVWEWYCPDCNTFYPLDKDPDRWIVYRPIPSDAFACNPDPSCQ